MLWFFFVLAFHIFPQFSRNYEFRRVIRDAIVRWWQTSLIFAPPFAAESDYVKRIQWRVQAAATVCQQQYGGHFGDGSPRAGREDQKEAVVPRARDNGLLHADEAGRHESTVQADEVDEKRQEAGTQRDHQELHLQKLRQRR